MNSPAARARVFANVGCGPRGGGRTPACFAQWQQVRVDVDPAVEPDIVGELTDLSAMADESVDAIWAAHCVEHLFLHEVPRALVEFHRVLRPDGFACIVVPDLQAVAQYVAADRLHQPMYQSPAGPITPHDVIFGHGAAVAAGRVSMAHRCGFTPGLLLAQLRAAPFAEVVVRRRPDAFELGAVVFKTLPRDAAERDALVAGLQL